MSMTMARRNIHTAKSPKAVLPRIAQDNGIGLGMTTRRKRYCFQTGDDGNDDDDDW